MKRANWSGNGFLDGCSILGMCNWGQSSGSHKQKSNAPVHKPINLEYGFDYISGEIGALWPHSELCYLNKWSTLHMGNWMCHKCIACCIVNSSVSLTMKPFFLYWMHHSIYIPSYVQSMNLKPKCVTISISEYKSLSSSEATSLDSKEEPSM